MVNLPNSLAQKLLLIVPCLLQAWAHAGFWAAVHKILQGKLDVLCVYKKKNYNCLHWIATSLTGSLSIRPWHWDRPILACVLLPTVSDRIYWSVSFSGLRWRRRWNILSCGSRRLNRRSRTYSCKRFDCRFRWDSTGTSSGVNGWNLKTLRNAGVLGKEAIHYDTEVRHKLDQ